MLCSLNAQNYNTVPCPVQDQSQTRYGRNEKDDMQEAIKLLYEFKEKLDKLHPHCTALIENMLQGRRW